MSVWRIWPLSGRRSDLRVAWPTGTSSTSVHFAGPTGRRSANTAVTVPSRIVPATKPHSVYYPLRPLLLLLQHTTDTAPDRRLTAGPATHRISIVSSWIGPQVTPAVGRPASPPQRGPLHHPPTHLRTQEPYPPQTRPNGPGHAILCTCRPRPSHIVVIRCV